MITTAMIFAAGLGTRLKPLTDSMPKALVPVCGKPLIWHVSRKLMDAGIEGAVVNVHHFADSIEDWLASSPWVDLVSSDDSPVNQSGHFPECPLCNGEPGRLSLAVSDERAQLLETGGGIFHARRWLEGCGSFLVHNVDILSDLDFRWFMSQTRSDALSTLLVSERKTSRYLLFEPDTMRLVGWTNVMTGEIRSPYPDLDPSKCRMLAFSGIHILSDKVFEAMERYLETVSGDVRSSGRFPIIDFYLWACHTYNIYGVVADDLHVVDVGKLDSLTLAEDFVNDHKTL